MTGAVTPDDRRFMAAAIALAARGQGRTAPNPSVGCILVKDGIVIARGWTQASGRPHAEAMALAMAGDAARGSTAYVTLEPCAHESARGPACADSLIAAGVARVVIGVLDTDPRTMAKGLTRLMAAGIEVVTDTALAILATPAHAAHDLRQRCGRAQVTLKLATSLDGCIALASGESRWITGEAARRHTHLLRAQSDAILVGRGTWDADAPSLDVRLPGLADRSPQRLILTNSSPERGGGPPAQRGVEGHGPADPTPVPTPHAAATLPGLTTLLVEGGAATAAAFLRAGLVDHLILYRAPILIGAGRASLADIGLERLADAHGRWRLTDARQLGPDRLEIYAASGQEG